jgi:hypothetical protein
MNRSRKAILLVAVLSAAPALGQIVPTLGPLSVINETTAGAQFSPRVAFGPAGSYLAVWAGPDSSQHTQIFGRLLDATGAPSGHEFQMSSSGSTPAAPRVAGSGAGFAVAWVDQGGVLLRRYDPHGTPLGAAVRVDPSAAAYRCDVALNAAGDALVVWSAVLHLPATQSQVYARRVSPDGTLGDLKSLTPGSITDPVPVRVAAAPDGGFVAEWIHADAWPPTLRAQRVDSAGNWAAPLTVNVHTLVSQIGPRPLFRADGSFSILWTYNLLGPPISVGLRRSFDAAGNPLTDEAGLVLGLLPFDAVSDPAGNTLVLGAGGQGELFDSSWHGLTAVTFLPGVSEPALAADSTGNFVALWTLGREALPAYGDGSDSTILGRRLDAVPCIPGSSVLCLGPNGRFHARVAWTNPNNGDTGVGRSLPLTGDTGAFWFFGDQNLELMVKVLDGTTVNLRYWLYSGALSNVEYTLTVMDTLTGVERSYHNPAGQFASFADVTAFPFGLSDRAQTASLPAAVPSQASPSGCPPVVGPQSFLCLASGQFIVEVQFTDPRTGHAGLAMAVPLTLDSGAFWFFDDANLELMIKVLDGRAINGKFWVFYGALSDVEYTISVTHPGTGEVKTYHNPRGTLASRADTQAF